MLTYAILYIVIATATLTVLSGMILKIGSLIGDCPDSKRVAKVTSVTIATGYAAIGAGGVICIGAILPLVSQFHEAGLMFALGLAALCLGLGFTHAVSTLRAVVMQGPAPKPA